MSYTKIIKEQIINNKIKNQEKNAFLSAYIYLCENKEGVFIINDRYFFVIRALYNLLKEKKINVELTQSKKKYLIKVKKTDLEKSGIYKETRKYLKNEVEKRGYIKGLFISRGIITNPDNSYHLEFAFREKEKTEVLSDLLSSYSVNMSRFLTKGKYVLYNKNSDEIIGFMHLMGLDKLAFEYRDLIVFRNIKNDVNRIVNCETSNISKTVKASNNQKKWIEYIEKVKGLKYLNDDLYRIAIIRLENEDLSLKEIGELLDPKLTKSGVNNRFRRIKKIYEKLRME